MSELNVQAVQSQSLNAPVRFEDSAGTEIGTLCRAWVNFNGTGTVAIRASFNVLGITDIGTGIYDVNLTNALPDINFAQFISVCDDNVTARYIFETGEFGQHRTTSKLRVTAVNNAASVVDPQLVTVAIFR